MQFKIQLEIKFDTLSILLKCDQNTIFTVRLFSGVIEGSPR